MDALELLVYLRASREFTRHFAATENIIIRVKMRDVIIIISQKDRYEECNKPIRLNIIN